jgi:hypothetical protein
MVDEEIKQKTSVKTDEKQSQFYISFLVKIGRGRGGTAGTST